MITFAAVMVGGAIGAVGRYVLDVAITGRLRTDWPIGTMAVNVLGSLVLGLLVGAGVSAWPEPVQLGLATGFLGALTTFSTWMYETFRLMEEKAWRHVAWNVAGSIGLGLVAATAGLWIGRALAGGV